MDLRVEHGEVLQNILLYCRTAAKPVVLLNLLCCCTYCAAEPVVMLYL